MNRLNNFPYNNILVLGLGKSGISTCRVLANNGYNVIANDLNAKDDTKEIVELKQLGVTVIVGSHPLTLLEDVDVMIKSPGIHYDSPLVEHALKRDIPVVTEIELVPYLTKNPLIAITGSNGKTTTTMLTYEMLKQSNKQAKIAGNIGTVAVEVAEQLKEDEQMVLELSSFQLMGTESFRPKIAVFLNLFATHLDYHGTFKDYGAAKAKIFANQTKDDYVIYNEDDKSVREMVAHASGIKVPFSTRKRLDSGVWCDDTYLYYKEEKIMKREEIRLVGAHNLENIMASAAASLLAGGNKVGIHKVLTTFGGVRHRLQFVSQINGRLFYNDSKATNILASSKALSSFTQPTILLAGGLDRGNDFDELVPYLDNVKAMVLYGETADKLELAAKKANVESVVKVKDLEDAVQEAYQRSEIDDVILLSPACASWDQFRTFEERGDMFIDLVHRLE